MHIQNPPKPYTPGAPTRAILKGCEHPGRLVADVADLALIAGATLTAVSDRESFAVFGMVLGAGHAMRGLFGTVDSAQKARQGIDPARGYLEAAGDVMTATGLMSAGFGVRGAALGLVGAGVLISTTAAMLAPTPSDDTPAH